MGIGVFDVEVEDTGEETEGVAVVVRGVDINLFHSTVVGIGLHRHVLSQTE